MSPQCGQGVQGVQMASKIEHTGEGNINTTCGGGDINNISGGVVNQFRGQGSPRDALEKWLNGCGDVHARQINDHDFTSHEKTIQEGTGEWLFSERAYLEWSSISSPSSNATCPNVLWLYGNAGFGKSVLCAHAIRHMRDLWESDREVAVAYQFYKMGNESETPMTACLNLAKMLLEERFKADDKVPDQIMAIIKAHPPNETWLRKLIELLVREFKAVYIFVDGLDEMVDAAEKNRWPRAEDFLKFILRLAVGARSPDDDFDTVVKVWVSSQTRQKIIEAIFSSIPATSIVSTSSPPGTTALAQIPLTRKLNESDISAMFRYTMTVARSYDTFGGSEGINKVLEKVQLAVKGNFLWARLMIDSIANANSPAQAMEASETVPEDFGTYLGNRIKAQLEKHPQRRRDAALILSCLLYAQRPILVDELCDAVCAARIPTSGRNVRKEDRLFKDKIEEICAPLVKVNRLNRDDQTVGICTLYHSAVWKFLRDTPSILVPNAEGDAESGDEEYILTPRTLGVACMRYLQQGRYKRPLLCPSATGGRGFLTSCQEQQNIDTHAFLTYCAKYWARHQELEHAMSTLPESRRDEIYEFVSSSQFRTTLQVQSLFVEAQFGFMLSTGHEEEGVHLVRAFPRFFTETEEFPIGKRVQQQYNEAIGEFGYYLNSLSRFHEQLAGQIDRCLWGMLGKSNMFRRVSSHLRSFKLETKRTPDDEARYLYHDNVIMSNKGITIFSVSSRSTGKNIRLELETFEVKPGRDSKHSHGEVDPVEVTAEKLGLYRRPLREYFPGRPSAVLISSDGRVLRVGSKLFINDGGSFRQLDLDGIPPTERMDFFEEVGSRGPWVAIGRRRNITSVDLAEVVEECEDGLESEGNDQTDVASSSGFSDTDCGDTNSVSDETGSVDSSECHGLDKLPHAKKEDDATESDLESADHNSTCCSAPDSCSIRSTPTQSDELGHGDDFWNDWFSDDEDLQIDDITNDNIMNDSDELRFHQSLEDIFEESAIATTFDEKSDIASQLSAGHLDDVWSSSDESDNPEVVFHDDRRKPPNPGSTGVAGVRTHLCELLVLNTDRSAPAPLRSTNDDGADESTVAEEKQTSLRVFRFEHKSSGLIFSSPPVIHPQHSLLVWPLGGGEVLFANFAPPDKSFFTVRLSAGSGIRMCHISMQAKFSPCGNYLNIACLDVAVPERVGAADRPMVQIKQLELHISTYRLSVRKPERSKPRLVYSTSCPLEAPGWNVRAVRDNDGLKPLPWTLTWEWDDGEGGAHVYACQSSPCLRVVRAPLFAHVEARERELDGPEVKDENDALSAFVNVQPVFLPLSAQCRRVHFFPHSSGSSSSAKVPDQRDDMKAQQKQTQKRSRGKKTRDKKKHGVGVGDEDDDPFVATVVVSSEDARNSGLDHARNLAGEYRGPAQIAQLRKSQFGDWKRLRYSEKEPGDNLGVRRPTRMETWRGQLLSKYEKFDKRDDCDIVPYTGMW